MEPIQYEDLHREKDEGLSLKTGASKKVIRLGLVLITLLSVFLLFVKIPRSKNMDFVLKGGVREQVVQFSHPVIIYKKYIEPNQNISFNDRLVGLKSSLISSQIDEYQEAVNKLEYFERYTAPVNGLKIQNQKALLKTLEYRLNFLDELIDNRSGNSREIQKITSMTLAEERKSYARERKLMELKVTSESSLERVHTRLLNAQQDSLRLALSNTQVLENLNRQLVELQSEILKINQEVSSLRLNDSLIKEKLTFDIEQQKQMIRRNFGHVEIAEDHLVLLSKWEGVVSLINESESVIPVGESVLKISNGEEPYYAYAEVGSMQLTELEPNSEVRLKFDGYPHYLYGSQKALISSMSLTTNENGNYQVRIDFDKSEDFGQKLTKGMTGVASVKTIKSSILAYLMTRMSSPD